MVICAMEASVPPPPPMMGRPCSKDSQRSTSKGFRLLDDQAETGSVYSIYKQKIDSMFESDSSQVSNTVQARIERMFTEVAKDENVKSDIGNHSFSIDYLGSIPLLQKVTSLAGLQIPLKDLYFSYKRNTRLKKTLTGRLEISQSGLKVQYQGDKGDLEQLNPFPTIAVWSAVKFVLHQEPKRSYAFLPLITDPDNIDKQTLFRDLEDHESKYIVGQTHAPLFAVVMRKIGLHKQLECHGFVCQTSEDAIVIAATLYKSLMSHMKLRDKKPKNRNGVSCVSMTSSICADSIQPVPVRPPRKKRSTTSSVVSESDTLKDSDNNRQVRKSTKTRKAPTIPLPKDMDEILPYEEPHEMKKDKRKEPKMTEDLKQWNESEDSELKRTRSVRKRSDDGIMSKSGEISGDILTKVTIPRSGSFLNHGGLTRYKSKANRCNGQASGGSPLGFNELFNEFRLQEGLHSMDEILGVIIDSEGMSFNDLKPIYKEFLLKLAVTLTKDELYQRSKSIMRRQKKKILRKNSSIQKRRNIIVGAKGLKRVFRKSFRLNLSKKLYNKKARKKRKTDSKKEGNSEKKPAQESSISTSSYDTRQFTPKDETQIVRKQSYRKKNSDIKEANMRARRDRMSTSEDSDFFTMKRSKPKTSPSNQNRNSSSGYVSCSECSYDSDTCTCVSADKCYCSLGNNNGKKPTKPRPPTASSWRTDDRCYCSYDKQSFTVCGCDTDSCTDSNKCYCQTFAPKGTIFEQLKRRGFIPTLPTSENMITPPNERKLCKKNSNTRSTKSVEYLHNPSEKYYEKIQPKSMPINDPYLSKRSGSRRSYSSDNLALDFETFGGRNPVYSKAMSEVPPRQFPMQNSVRSFQSFTANSRRSTGKTLQATIPTNSSTEALSVKKSAEIAALFADIKLSQTTDITHLISRDFQDITSNMPTSYYKPSAISRPPQKPEKKAIVTPYKHVNNKMVQNSLYQRNQSNGKGLYSARNGLYTIQSQSDSSCSDNKTDKKYFMNQDGKKKSVSNLENSLGYLP